MRILHTSDWHLGRALAGERLLGDQEHALQQIAAVVRGWHPDVVAIAGDVYDRAVPPPEAVELLDDTLSEIVFGSPAHVVLIAGNHDSPQRLAFARRLLEASRVHVAGEFAGGNRVRLADRWGELDIYSLPYLDPASVREELESGDIADHESAARAMIAHIRATEMAPRSVLLAHAFVAGASPTESERPLAVAGAGTVSGDCFDGLSYVALGHLHRAQRAGGRDSIQYSGSIFKYSFSEERDVKSINLVEIGADGACSIERHPLTALRDVRTISGTFDELIANGAGDGRQDLLRVALHDERPVLDALARLREVYPNVLEVKQERVRPAAAPGASSGGAALSAADLFEAFFQQTTGEELDADERAEFAAVLEEVERARRLA